MQHVADFLQRLDGELAERPLYLLPQSRLPSERGGGSVCEGFTSPRLDLYLQDVIGKAWRGRGPCIVVNDADADTLAPEEAKAYTLAVALHELAHVLARPANDWGETLEEARRLFEGLAVGYFVSRPEPGDDSVPPWQGHGPRFIRAAVHLEHRAKAAGAVVGLSGYVAGRRYGLSPYRAYRDALGDEAATWADRPIRMVLDCPWPKRFRRLWTADAGLWFRSQRRNGGMSISEMLERLVGRERQQKTAAAIDFDRLVARIADGKKTTDEEILRALAAANKTADELKHAVEALQHRRELQARRARLPALLAERQRIEERIAAEKRELVAAEQRHDEAMFRLSAELDSARAAIHAAEEAAEELVASCDDAALREELETVAAELSEARRSAVAYRTAFDQWKERAAAADAEVEQARRIIEGETLVERAEARQRLAKQRVIEAENAIRQTDRRIRELEQQAERVREKMRRA